MLQTLILVMALLFSLSPFAYSKTSYPATVTKVIDGDSVWIKSKKRGYMKTRLLGIDAPELKQKHGKTARTVLKSRCKGKRAEFIPYGKDRYKRQLIKLFCNGQNMNEYLVREGFAWAYPSKTKNRLYKVLEIQANYNQKGIWSGKEKPVPPWEFRKKTSEKSKSTDKF